MSTRWTYTNRNGIGVILTIYCTASPTDDNPTGEWFISRKMGPGILLKHASENSFFYYEDKNAYNAAKVNAREVARKYMNMRQKCCIIM